MKDLYWQAYLSICLTAKTINYSDIEYYAPTALLSGGMGYANSFVVLQREIAADPASRIVLTISRFISKFVSAE
jgi:hypothetical protein